ncbi:MAG: hemolysin family protein [Planctomycetota bacterium]
MTATAWVWIAVAAVSVGGFLSALFYALSDLSRPALEEIAARMNRPSSDRYLRRILEDLTGHAHAIALLRISCNAMAAVSTTLAVAGFRKEIPGGIDVLIGVPTIGIIVWVFGLVIPASVARHAGEQAVYSWALVIRVVYWITKPLQAVVRFFDEVVRRLAGHTAQDQADEMKAEVLSVVEDGLHEGQFDDSEKQMIEAVVSFRDTTVAQIMTPRTEMEAMDVSVDLGRVTASIRKGGHSRVPVYDGAIDRVVGIFYVKDLMRWLAGESSRGGRTFSLRQIIRPAVFVPETKTVRELLGELLAKRVHIAIVADEFGGTAGLVTIEDIVEEVFGDIQDEYERPVDAEDEIKIDAATGSAEIDARTYIADANEELRSLSIELPEGEDYDTVGGFITVTLGRIPARGEIMTHAGVSITIVDAEATRVTRVRLARAAPPPLTLPAPGDVKLEV